MNASAFNFPARSHEEPAMIAPQPTRMSLIQIVEDDLPLAATLAAGLESRGYRAVCSANAADAMEQARRQRPDLLLCDINMPRRNGHQLLRDFRADPALADCQIVLMTGNAMHAQPRAGMDLGADDFLLKPFTLDTLANCVAARLERAGHQRRAEERLLRELRASLGETLPHELFTPLGGIIGFSEMLAEESRTKNQDDAHSAAHHILRSGERLHRTLRNYLAVLGLGAGDSNSSVETLAAASVGQVIARGVRTAAVRRERTADVVLELSPAPLRATPDDLTVIVDELTDNALKFSPRGSPVRVNVAEDAGRLTLTFIDRGRGLTASQIQAIGMFRQFDRRKFEQQGLGLGLAVVRQALHRLDGELKFASAVGEGTTVQVHLPIHRPPAEDGR
ncbi:MAG: hybrid sensor histidine kinase/response regulator [Opitutae bacterium]|nr:hybrid sensor histidine kinase/response regulator [Opitutae bacterium]